MAARVGGERGRFDGGAHLGAQHRGTVRVAGHALADDGGPFVVLGASLFWAAWGYRHDRPRLEANLSFLASHGVDAVRVLGVVGPDRDWADRTVDPSWHDYDEVVSGLTDLAFDDYGLRVQWTIFGGIESTPTPRARKALVARFRRLLEPRAEKVLFVEVANEGYQTGFDGVSGMDEIRALGRDLAGSNGLLVALTAPSSLTNMLDLHRASGVDVGGADVVTLHYDRDVAGVGGPWQPARLPWAAASLRSQSEADLPPVFASNEPIGPGSSVAEERDPSRLVASAVVAWISGHAAYVYHSGAGVRGGGQGDLDRGRVANVYDVPDAASQLDALARVKALMPSDLADWPTVEARDPAHPLGDSVDDAFCARREADFVCAIIALDEKNASPRASSAMRVTVHAPVSGNLSRSVTLAAGDPIPLVASESVMVLIGRVDDD